MHPLYSVYYTYLGESVVWEIPLNHILVMFSYNRRGALVKWKQHQGPGATYRKLIMAFEEAHRLDLADVVDRLAGKVTSDQAQGTSDNPVKGISFLFYYKA